MDQGQVSISVSMPIGSEVDETSAISERISGIAQEQVPEMESMYYMAQPESSTISLTLVNKSERDRSSAEVADGCGPRWRISPAVRSRCPPPT